MSDILSALNWRYACKVFDASKHLPMSGSHWRSRWVLTPSSFGLQPWRVLLVIQDKELRIQVGAARSESAPSGGLFPPRGDDRAQGVPSVDHIDANITRMIEVRGGTADALMGFRKMVVGFRDGMEAKGGLEQWAKLQSYIALGQFMLAASLCRRWTLAQWRASSRRSLMKCSVLEATGYTTAVLCPAGYRSEDDRYASLPKVRFEAKDVIEHH